MRILLQQLEVYPVIRTLKKRLQGCSPSDGCFFISLTFVIAYVNLKDLNEHLQPTALMSCTYHEQFSSNLQQTEVSL